MGMLISEFFLKNLTKVVNCNLLREIDPHGNELMFAEKLDCILDKTTDKLKGYYNCVFGPYMWPLPLNTYDLAAFPEYWYVIITYGLLNGQIFDKFKILANKFVINPSTLTFESVLSNSKIFKIANNIKQNSLTDKKRLCDNRLIFKTEILNILKDTFVQKVEKVYDKLFN